MDEIQIGKVGVSVLMMGILAFIYKMCKSADGTECISDRGKQAIALGVGFILSYIAMFYQGIAPTFKNGVDFGVTGLVLGLNAIGIWELVKPKK